MVKERTRAIRARTWGMSGSLVVVLVLYLLVNVGLNEHINLVDLLFLGTVQVIVHCLYFPDGEIFGTAGETFKRNKAEYNRKATAINKNRCVTELREYCKVDLERRKIAYTETECGAIGIEVDELALLRQKEAKEILKMERWENNGKVVYFTKNRRKRLYRLIFEPIPVEENNPDTILSAVETEISSSIKDGAPVYRAKSYTRKFFMAFVVALFFAYVGYSVKDGISLAVIVKIATYLVSMITSAVFAFSQGETCSKVYKNLFYIKLSNFIDGFIEWLATEKKVEIQLEND